MKDMPQDLRTQTLDLVTSQATPGATDQVRALISAWLGSLDEEDLAGTAPQALAPVLWDGFMQAAKRTSQGCQIAQLRYTDTKGGMATALLILNDDMPYLVDSFVMALRKERVLAAPEDGKSQVRIRDGQAIQKFRIVLDRPAFVRPASPRIQDDPAGAGALHAAPGSGLHTA